MSISRSDETFESIENSSESHSTLDEKKKWVFLLDVFEQSREQLTNTVKIFYSCFSYETPPWEIERVLSILMNVTAARVELERLFPANEEGISPLFICCHKDVWLGVWRKKNCASWLEGCAWLDPVPKQETRPAERACIMVRTSRFVIPEIEISSNRGYGSNKKRSQSPDSNSVLGAVRELRQSPRSRDLNRIFTRNSVTSFRPSRFFHLGDWTTLCGLGFFSCCRRQLMRSSSAPDPSRLRKTPKKGPSRFVPNRVSAFFTGNSSIQPSSTEPCVLKHETPCSLEKEDQELINILQKIK